MSDYKFIADRHTPSATKPACVIRQSDLAAIPFDMANKDCAQFIVEWKNGAEVLTSDDSPAPYGDDAVRALGLEPSQ